MVDLIYCPAVWGSPGAFVDVLVLEEAAADFQFVAAAEAEKSFSIFISFTNCLASHHILPSSFVVSNLCVKISQ